MKFRFQRKFLAIPYFIFLILFIVLPILFIIYYAFTDSNGFFTFDAVVDFFTSTNKLNVLLLSLMFAMLNTIICLVIGYPIKIALGFVVLIAILLVMMQYFKDLILEVFTHMQTLFFA